MTTASLLGYIVPTGAARGQPADGPEQKPLDQQYHRQQQKKDPEILDREVQRLVPRRAGIELTRVRSFSNQMPPERPAQPQPGGDGDHDHGVQEETEPVPTNWTDLSPIARVTQRV